MLYTRFILTAVLLLALLPPARAQSLWDAATGLQQQATSEASSLTEPRYISMVFFKLGGQEPDFAAWARESDAYKTATPFEQPDVLKQKVEELRQFFRILSTRDPITVEMQAKLSAYDQKNRGFFVENFKTSTFFPVHYMDRSFAVVPQGLVDKQWLKVDDTATAAALEMAARSNGERLLRMTLQLTPQYVDAKSPASIGGEVYWPLVASVRHMALYGQDGKTLLWQSAETVTSDSKQQSIINLYQ